MDRERMEFESTKTYKFMQTIPHHIDSPLHIGAATSIRKFVTSIILAASVENTTRSNNNKTK